MARYVWRDGHWVNRETGVRAVPDGHVWQPVAPAIIGDIAPYQSPVTGEVISGRAGKRDDLRRHGCVDAADLPTLGGEFRDPKFAAKRGMIDRLERDK